MDNKVLKHALDVAAQVKKLQATVSTTKADHKRDLDRQLKATDRLKDAYGALEDAMRALAAENTELESSSEQEAEATDALVTYQAEEAEKTQEARKGYKHHS